MSSGTDVRVVDDGVIEVRLETKDQVAVTRAIVTGLAKIQNVPEAELDPLYDHIEPEALTTLIEHARREERSVGVEFICEDYTIVVTSDGHVCIHDGQPVLDRVPRT